MYPRVLSLPGRNFLRTSSSNASTLGKTLNPIPASFLRGGTSKGVFLQEKHLPHNHSHWDPIFLGIMGSPDPEYGRQLDGMGGGISSLSKICVVGPPTTEQASQGIHVQYTFVQVGIRDRTIDYSGNCGNLSSMIGVFAVDEGLCKPQTKDDGIMATTTVRSFNTNTHKIIDMTFPVTHGGVPLLDLPQTSIAGVSGTTSRITLDFVNPGGASTGKLLPTNSPTDVLEVSLDGHNLMSFSASLVDATNPTVFLSYNELEDKGLPIGDYINGVQPCMTRVGSLLENLRQEGAKKMGLDPSTQAQPKVAFLAPPNKTETNSHLSVYALSMGVLHKAVPMTVGLCLGVASKIEGTIPWRIINDSAMGNSNVEFVTLRHPGGVVDVGAQFDKAGNVTSANVIRTGRRLMKGSVWW